MGDDLQFDKAETQPGNPVCKSCNNALSGHYFQAGPMMVCERCASGIQAHLAGVGSSGGRFTKALLLGSGAAAIGAIVYGLWIALSNSEFALVTIAIGWFVGRSVRKGSGGRGGWRYGLTAVLLTYVAISMSFMMAGIIEMLQHAPKGGEVDVAPDAGSPGLFSILFKLFWLSLIIPVVSAQESILSVVITGFGLWQAWVMNRTLDIEITGPHTLGGGAPPSSAGA